VLEALKRLLSPEYLVVAEPGPLGSLWVLYVALGLLFAAGLAVAAWLLAGSRRGDQPAGRRAWAWFELWVCLAGLGTVVGRFLGWPGWSARIWPYSLAALALVGAAAYRWRAVRLPRWLAGALTVMAPAVSADEEPAVERGGGALLLVAGLAVHLAGTGLVLAGRYGWPAWSAVPVLAGLLLPQAPLLLRRKRPRLAPLAPLLGAYALTLLWRLYLALGITVIDWQGLRFPDPMTSLFYVDAAVLAVVAWSLLAQFYVTSRTLGRPGFWWRWAVAALLATVLLWAGIVYFGKRTHGATASDPYAYAQMGVDLAERGTFAHRFSLFEQVIPLEIAWAPLQPVGYHIPRNDLGDCPSVWATGASALLAAGYGLLGEGGLYVTTPLVALLALAATWALAQETLRGESPAVRHLTAALAVALLATSPEHVDRLLVPMADAPAQLFTVLTLLFLLRGLRRQEEGHRAARPFLLAGLCFAWAYWVRHTQLVLGLAVILGIGTVVNWDRLPTGEKGETLPMTRSVKLSLFHLGLFGVAAVIGAVPDIVYRWRWFGGPFTTETTELPLMGLQHVGAVAWEMLRATLVAGEWGYLFPLALYGAYRLARDRRREALVLGSAFGAVLFVHLTYHSLRLRDLISLFPLLDLAVAYGAVALLRMVRRLIRGRGRRLGTALLPAAAVGWIVLSLALSRWAMVDNVWKRGWASFGYMRSEHRAAFERLEALTPPEAVIGASLNAGAVMMYTGRDAVRPYDSWSVEEWGIFLEAMRRRGRAVYLLDDGGLMADFIEAEETRHRLIAVEELEVPLFYTQGRETGWLYKLEWDE
jgi:hypothetical protein